MLERNLILLLLVLLAPRSFAAESAPFFAAGHDPKPADKSWYPVEKLSDDFEGSTLDSSKWQSEPKGNGWNWVGRPPALFKASNVSLAEGEMRVTVGKLDQPVEKSGRNYTHQGAIVRSRNPGQVGWYYETRMKANQTEMSSTFWLMTKGNTNRRLELDIQECVGRTTDLTASWAKKWDRIFHSNAIHHVSRFNSEKVQLQGSVRTETKNWQRFYVYGGWWKSPDEIQFFLDGKYAYSIRPKVAWDLPAYLQMAIETYDWNPLPEDGGLVESGTKDQRTTRYDWVRVWRLE